MLISARAHYATLAMIELAIRLDDAAPVPVRDITDKHNIPGPFLNQIFRALRSAGWVQSVRGSQGGYRLTVDPASITLLEITEAVGCQESGHRVDANASGSEQILQSIWDGALEASRASLRAVRLIDLAHQCQQGDAAMFYI